MSKRVVILGARGHARVVHDALRLSGYEIIAFLDDDPALAGAQVMGLPVLGPCDQVRGLALDGAIVGIGDNRARQTLYEQLCAWDVPLVNAIHPSTVIAQDVQLGRGIAILAHVVVNPGTTVGSNVILNTASTVDHDCCLEEHVHIAPGVHLCGGVHVGRGTLIGVGASVIPGVRIGAATTIGAGAAVIADIPDGVIAVGVPARVIQ